MPLEHFGKAPYAPSQSVIDVIEKHRQVGLTKIDDAVLDARVGITKALRPRTLASLEMLDFIKADGTISTEFARLAEVPDEHYKSALADMLRAAYKPIIDDLKTEDIGDAAKVEGAFRSFTPVGQIKRMVNLYLGLMSFAGVITQGPRTRGSKSTSTHGASPKTRNTHQSQQKPPPQGGTPERNPMPPSAYSRSVDLDGNAGTITLSGTVNPFALKGVSREFVFSMIDLMDDYSTKISHQQPAGAKTQGGEHA